MGTHTYPGQLKDSISGLLRPVAFRCTSKRPAWHLMPINKQKQNTWMAFEILTCWWDDMAETIF